MKKILLVSIGIILISCTKNSNAKNFGGTEQINLPKNRILLNATWKKDNLWILTKDTLENKIYFNEKSNFGVLEGTIIFN